MVICMSQPWAGITPSAIGTAIIDADMTLMTISLTGIQLW
jgi:hypothetical protein